MLVVSRRAALAAVFVLAGADGRLRRGSEIHRQARRRLGNPAERQQGNRHGRREIRHGDQDAELDRSPTPA